MDPKKSASIDDFIIATKDERLATELDIPALPEMLFGNNSLEIKHEDGFSICFNAKDALKGVDNKHDLMHVAVAEEWQKLRADAENIKNVVKPYDWTYTTAYRGTFFDKRSSNTSKFVETDERIDLEKLKAREKIHFYEDILLFEDELGDNGMASMNIKIRVMPSSFFALLRFFLRVDNVLIRINDTRLYHEAGSSIILREYSSKEKKVSELKDPYADSSILADQLDLKLQCFEKLDFSKTADVKTEEASCHGDNQTR